MINNSIAVEFKGVSKAFAAVQANSNVNFSVISGTIHGIVGENGAGKSTAMKILYGMYNPSAGEIFLFGKPCKFSTPQQAIKANIGMVHQHFMLARPYSALDNIILGWEPTSFLQSFLPFGLGKISRSLAEQKIEKIMADTGLYVPLNTLVEDLPVGVQQRIEILKLLYRDANVLILDEPTAVLTPQEVEELFVTLRALKQSGKTIILITHKLKEVKAITDYLTVFRGGQTQATLKTEDYNQEQIAEFMVGRKISLSRAAPAVVTTGANILEISNVTVASKSSNKNILSDLSLTIAAGEIVGIAGVEGNGQSELLKLILHPEEFFSRQTKKYKATGTVTLLSNTLNTLTASQVRNLPLGVIPEDRQRDGLLMDSSLNENFLLGLHHETDYVKYGFLRLPNIMAATTKFIKIFDVRPQAIWNKMRALSGGNQQKLVIAREFSRNPKFLIAAHPTRGVDIGAIELIHNRIFEARAQGVGVLLVSSELDEIQALSDRIIVLYEGKIAGIFSRGQASAKTLGIYMTGSKGNV